jgi:hypothetical protein
MSSFRDLRSLMCYGRFDELSGPLRLKLEVVVPRLNERQRLPPHHQLTAGLRAAGLGAIADPGFVGLDDSDPDTDPAVITGYKAARNRPLTRGQKLANGALAAVWAPVEHGFAHLKNWRVLGKVRTDPRWATALVRVPSQLTIMACPAPGLLTCPWSGGFRPSAAALCCCTARVLLTLKLVQGSAAV